MEDRIEKEIIIHAPVARVWKALTDYKQFNDWFGIALNDPIVVGKTISGKSCHAVYNHTIEMTIEKMETEKYFSYRWHPFCVDKTRDYSSDSKTLVEYTLKAVDQGTLLRVVESGFNKVAADRREEAFNMHTGGWPVKLEAIQKFTTEHLANAS